MRRTIFMPVLLALLIVGLCLTNLTGCTEKTGDTQAPNTTQNEPSPTPAPVTESSGVEPEEPSIPDPATPVDGPLTVEELRYFNEEYFNGDYMNIRNQFLASDYESPEWIDFYDLFHYGAGSWGEAITDEERAAFEAALGDSVDSNVTKVSASNVDAMLTEYMGLTAEETNKIHLDNITYLPEYDAYYVAHGDTNYWSNVSISAGDRQDGLLCLYYSYSASYYGDGWKCVTLRETEDGYQFVSNMICNKSDVPNP